MAADTLTVLIDDEESAAAVLSSFENAIKAMVQATRDVTTAMDARRLLVLTSATHLREIAPLISDAVRKHHLIGLLVRSDIDPMWLPQVMDHAGVRTLQRMFAHSDSRVPERVVWAWANDVQEETIADATVLDDCLMLLTCKLERFDVPLESLPALRQMPTEERAYFEISKYGTYIHWPKSDVHLDLDAILVALDPARRRAAELERVVHDRAFGAAIRAFRENCGVRQSAVPGLSERQIRRIEKGETPASVDAIEALAPAHNMDPDAYLEAVLERMTIEQ